MKTLANITIAATALVPPVKAQESSSQDIPGVIFGYNALEHAFTNDSVTRTRQHTNADFYFGDFGVGYHALN